MYSRSFHSLHPITLLIYYLLVFTALMLFQQPVFLFFSILILLTHNKIVDQGKKLRQWIQPTLLFAGLLFLINPIFNRRGTHILFYFYGQPVLLESVLMGLMSALTLLAIIFLFTSMNQILTIPKITYLISFLSYRFRILIVLSLRFIPRLKKQIEEMLAIQKLKGRSIEKGQLKLRLTNAMKIVSMLLTASLESSIQTADSMTARAYGQFEQSRYRTYEMKKKDFFFLFLFLVITFILAYLSFQSATRLILTPSLQEFTWSVHSILALVLWILFLSLPILMEGVEHLKWKSYLFKI